MTGRKRKPGTRYPKNGRLTRAAYAEDVMEIVIEARMRIYGVTKQEAVEREPTGESLIGTALGRLLKYGYISKAQYTAGGRYMEAKRTFGLTYGTGSITASAFDMDRHGASLSETPVRGRDECREYDAALAEVDRLNPGKVSATGLLTHFCRTDSDWHMSPRDLGVFREGLNAIDRCIRMREKMRKAA